MSEAAHQIVFRDAHTMAIRKVVPVQCGGVNHADFSADGRYFIVSCEFSGDLLKVDTEQQRVVAQLHLPKRMAMPQDVKVSPDGKTWYIADMQSSGLWILHDDRFAAPTFLPTGEGAHGLYVSRDSKRLYITNRGEGTISVLDFATNKLIAKWTIPGHATPDMGGISADGRTLWLSGRYNNVVYAIDTTTGKLIRKIPVGANRMVCACGRSPDGIPSATPASCADGQSTVLGRRPVVACSRGSVGGRTVARYSNRACSVRVIRPRMGRHATITATAIARLAPSTA